MAFVHGKDASFSIDSNDLTQYLTEAGLDQPVDTAETSTMGNSAKTYIEGMSDGKVSIAGRYDSTALTGPDVVLAGLKGGGAVAFEFGPEGDATGKVKYSGDCIMTGYNVTAPVGDVVAFTAEFQVTGAITKGTFS